MNIWEDTDLPYSFDDSNVVGQVVKFFKTKSELIYPAKSYFVALVYAKCMGKFFKMTFFDALDDNELLPDDRFFVPYHEDKKTYDGILDSIPEDKILSYPSVEKTVEYFKREFLLHGIDH